MTQIILYFFKSRMFKDVKCGTHITSHSGPLQQPVMDENWCIQGDMAPLQQPLTMVAPYNGPQPLLRLSRRRRYVLRCITAWGVLRPEMYYGMYQQNLSQSRCYVHPRWSSLRSRIYCTFDENGWNLLLPLIQFLCNWSNLEYAFVTA